MATIKDIAKVAGVSQGTVSNVLNGKGNVSSQKIRLVQEAAKRLGYTMNQRAHVLRKGSSNTLAVVVPDLYNRQYVDFYTSFHKYAQEQGYQVNVYQTEDSPLTEKQVMHQLRSNITAAAAVFTCITDEPDPYGNTNLEGLVYIQRSPAVPCTLLSFNMYEIGNDLAHIACKRGLENVAVLTENPDFSSQKNFLQGFQNGLEGGDVALSIFHTDEIHCPNDAFQILNAVPAPQGVFVTNYAFALTLDHVSKNFSSQKELDIYSLSPLFTMPQDDFKKYELNYRLMGKTAAQMLIESLISKQPLEKKNHILPGDGLRNWIPQQKKKQGKLTVVTLDSPSARILKNVSQLYTKATGIEINVAFYSPDGLNEIFSNIENTDSFDVIRIDRRFFPWYAEKTFLPLTNIDPDIEQIFETFLPGLSKEYSHFNNKLYALPSTPSSQLLFYRKDLFENPAWRRQYFEQFQRELEPPVTFEEFNRIARFFTRKLNPSSPVPYGTTLTMGNSNLAGREYLTRYFSHCDHLYNQQQLLLTSDWGRQAMEELVEAKDFIGSEPCATWQEAAQEFARGNVAMSIMFSNFASGIAGTDSQVLNKVGFALVPGGNPMTGGSALGVCRYSKQPEEALAFIRWLCSEEVATAMTLMGTMSPCIKTYENYEVMDLYPWMIMVKDSFAYSKTSYTPQEKIDSFDEPKFLGILGMAVHTAYNQIMPVKEALHFAQSTFEKSFRV